MPEVKSAIARLQSDEKLHHDTLEYCLRRIRLAEREMQKLHAKWQIAEKLYQAYIKMEDYEKLLKKKNDEGEAPRVISVQVPYAFASINTICTYLLTAFSGRRPMFQVSSYSPNFVEAAKSMEIALQYNADHCRLVFEMWKYLLSTQVYGIGIFRTRWTDIKRMSTIIRQMPNQTFWGNQIGMTSMRTRQLRTVYSGNEVAAIDPWLFFPDPRVPMTEVNRKGEFVFWREFVGKFALIKEQAAGKLFGVDKIKARDRTRDEVEGDSARGLRTGGAGIAAVDQGFNTWSNMEADQDTQTVQLDIGTIEINPKKLNLSDFDGVQKWIFVIANKNRIIMADPFENDHDMHPVAVAEPLAQGWEFGGMSMADYLKPINDTVTWFVNSHIYNVRTALNNMYVVDPGLIEMQDLKNPGPGRHIRLKSTAQGMDVRAAITQLATADMTGKHMTDLKAFLEVGEMVSAASQNYMGQQDSGGRKTATEVRTAGEAAASRLASTATIISAQGLVDLRTQMCLNVQQFQEEAFYANVLGAQAAAKLMIQPEQLVGDFYYPIHDGTLPVDRTAMAMVWKEILQFLSTQPALMQYWDINRVFENTAKLAGATDIESYKVPPQPMLAPQLGAPPIGDAGSNVVPLPGPREMFGDTGGVPGMEGIL